MHNFINTSFHKLKKEENNIDISERRVNNEGQSNTHLSHSK